MYGQPSRIGMDPNKFVTQMIVQALQAFYNQDYETGTHFIEQIRSNLPSFLYNLNPALRTLCKDIVKLVQGGSLVQQHALTEEVPLESQSPTQQSLTQQSLTQQSLTQQSESLPEPFEGPPDSPTQQSIASADFIAELSSVVKSQKEKKKKKVVDELKGSITDLEDFDF
ncbi:MAG: hypothetical protein ACTSPI_12150 [Candidatus Heimdallarchaeaceae archaeon]